jgi:GntR family transcriptional regulator/MocR family aminotransferase
MVEQCLVVKDAMGGDTPTHTQEALADFIREGDLLRHIRKMRRLYQHKHALTCQSINRHFSPEVEVISQAAGLHVTLRWCCSVNEEEFVSQAAANGLVIRALSYYEDSAVRQGITRDWGGVVLGFGNVALDDIESNIAQLARIFDSLMAKD